MGWYLVFVPKEANSAIGTHPTSVLGVPERPLHNHMSLHNDLTNSLDMHTKDSSQFQCMVEDEVSTMWMRAQ